MSGAVHYECTACGHRHGLDELVWRCGRCGGLLDLGGFVPELPPLPRTAPPAPGMWRYAGALPLPEGAELSMGEGWTPLVSLPGAAGVALKLDFLMPTGSFKDRGAVLLAALGRRLRVRRLLVDSSGNAAAALAAYAARAGVACEVYVPRSTSPGKIGQLRAYGATVRQVPGSRAAAAAAAADAASAPGVLYASHVYNPLFHHGTKTFVLELWEACGGRLPEVLVLPAGNGTLVLGAALACGELVAAGRLATVPRIVAVQAAACAPLAAAFRGGAVGRGGAAGGTIAEGIAIVDPPRAAQILAAVEATGGAIVTVNDAQVRAAHAALARLGFYVEPTAAVSFAAWKAGLLRTGSGEAPASVVIPLCGSGLKSHPPEPVP